MFVLLLTDGDTVNILVRQLSPLLGQQSRSVVLVRAFYAIIGVYFPLSGDVQASTRIRDNSLFVMVFYVIETV